MTKLSLSFAYLLASVCAVALVPAAAAAQDAPTKESKQLPQKGAAPDTRDTTGEIVVTATRREETLQHVPLAVTAYGQQQLTKDNIRTIDDLSRVTPGVSFTRSGYGDNRADPPVIRGINSAVGGVVTGLYVDDTPLNNIHSAGISSPPFPRLFDLERVEVLKGPQGTLFGAGAMGGAIRFITPTPRLNGTTLRATTELSDTAGDTNYEGGVALNTPLIEDKLGLRVSAFYRRDAGYTDHVDFYTKAVDRPNTNWSRAVVLDSSMLWKPTENLSITPSLLYQNEHNNDLGQFWLNISRPSNGKFYQEAPLRAPSNDKWFLPALKIQWDVGPATIISNTSYLSRKAVAVVDYTTEVNAIIFGLLGEQTLPTSQFPGEAMPAQYVDHQKTFTQEFRIQSADKSSRLQWVAGVFYSKIRQKDYQMLQGADSLNQLLEQSAGASTEDFFGIGPIDVDGFKDVTYAVTDRPTQQQMAAFAQVDYELLRGLKLTAGVRYSRIKSTFDAFTGGPFNGANDTNVGKNKENALTPKFGVSYQIDPHNLLYANVSKGYRPGGAQPPVPAIFCGQDLENLGISSPPTSYKSDSLWSYEAGSKNELFGGKVRLDASAYLIRWSNIQRNVYLPICTLSFIGNLGKVESKGFELALTARPFRGTSLSANIGYNNAKSLDTVATVGGPLLAKAGDSLGDRRWTITGGIQQDLTLFNHPSYIGLDVEYLGRGSDPFDPLVQAYDPVVAIQPKAYTIVKIRASMTFDKLEITPFIDNLFNAHPILTYGNYSTGSPLIYSTTEKPRTFGLRLTLRE